MTHLALEKPPYSFQYVEQSFCDNFHFTASCACASPFYSDAVQLIFSMHCCLHLVGQAVSVGRLDQLLQPYYQRDLENNVITREKVFK